MRYYLTLAIAAILACALIAAWTCALGADLASARAIHSCGQEDGTTWSWSTCGNHKRGVISAYGNRRVVGPCTFARMAREHTLDRRSTPTLRGDRWAIAHGCQAAHDAIYS